MIPKIIHLCWLSDDAYPPKISKCIKSWKKYLPDYKIMLWDTKRFDINESTWVKQAFIKKKICFCSRLHSFLCFIQLRGYIFRF